MLKAKDKEARRGNLITFAIVLVLTLVTMVLENVMSPGSLLFTVIKKGAVYSLVAVSMNLLNGFTGLFGYASTIVSGAGLGYLAQHYGWNHAYIAMIAMALVGMAVFLLMWGAGRDGYETDAE